eukprot:COSAG06_NODE_6421_length_2940_cov_1.951426_2_plen_269_part_00
MPSRQTWSARWKAAAPLAAAAGSAPAAGARREDARDYQGHFAVPRCCRRLPQAPRRTRRGRCSHRKAARRLHQVRTARSSDRRCQPSRLTAPMLPPQRAPQHPAVTTASDTHGASCYRIGKLHPRAPLLRCVHAAVRIARGRSTSVARGCRRGGCGLPPAWWRRRQRVRCVLAMDFPARGAIMIGRTTHAPHAKYCNARHNCNPQPSCCEGAAASSLPGSGGPRAAWPGASQHPAGERGLRSARTLAKTARFTATRARHTHWSAALAH